MKFSFSLAELIISVSVQSSVSTVNVCVRGKYRFALSVACALFFVVPSRATGSAFSCKHFVLSSVPLDFGIFHRMREIFML